MPRYFFEISYDGKEADAISTGEIVVEGLGLGSKDRSATTSVEKGFTTQDVEPFGKPGRFFTVVVVWIVGDGCGIKSGDFELGLHAFFEINVALRKGKAIRSAVFVNADLVSRHGTGRKRREVRGPPCWSSFAVSISIVASEHGGDLS